MSTQQPGTTRYDAVITRTYRQPDGKWRVDDLLSLHDVPAYELSPALKALQRKIHESPPPVVLQGQEPMI